VVGARFDTDPSGAYRQLTLFVGVAFVLAAFGGVGCFAKRETRVGPGSYIRMLLPDLVY